MPSEQEGGVQRTPAIAVDEARYRNEHQRQPAICYPPSRITFGITNVCNYRCSCCPYHNPDGAGIGKGPDIPFTMRPSEFARIVDMARTGRVREILVCGTGEPFMQTGTLDMVYGAASGCGKMSVQDSFSQSPHTPQFHIGE